jgi:hypothetical protein
LPRLTIHGFIGIYEEFRKEDSLHSHTPVVFVDMGTAGAFHEGIAKDYSCFLIGLCVVELTKDKVIELLR